MTTLIIQNASYNDTIQKVYAKINEGIMPNVKVLRAEVRNINKVLKAIKADINNGACIALNCAIEEAARLEGKKKAYKYFISICK